MILGHQLAAIDKSAKFEPNGMVAERKRIIANATGGGRKEEEEMKKWRKKILDNIPAIAEPAEVEEANQEQCDSDAKKKIKIK